jgi:hypothetical protein
MTRDRADHAEDAEDKDTRGMELRARSKRSRRILIGFGPP